MKTIVSFKKYSLYALLALGVAFTSCDDDDDDVPAEENVVEVFTNVKLIFTPTGGGTPVEARAEDPDGAGLDPLEVLGAINLSAETEYTLTFEILNALDPTDIENVGDEILEEDNEHQFFFKFSEGVFTSPTGDGNIDTASDPINYLDEDENGRPVGLRTRWTTGVAATGQKFKVMLQHQPDVKTDTSGSSDGDTDFALEFDLNIQ